MTLLRTIHPFPARMAPELAIRALSELPNGSIVLDPMTGSGLVARHASELGHRAIALDLDPLAVLMTKVWVTPVDDSMIVDLMAEVLTTARAVDDSFCLPWIDENDETKSFIKYWFAEPQLLDLRRLAYSLWKLKRLRSQEKKSAADLLRLALSRIIITKERGASLARDVSHSRPHKISNSSDYDVFPSFERSVRQLRQLLANAPPNGNVEVLRGDARSLDSVRDRSVDAVLTSPPYLNAIDYMRGHKLSLVWLGHTISGLRGIRADSIGAERGQDGNLANHTLPIRKAMCAGGLPRRYSSMIARYADDILRMLNEVSRVLKPKGRATFVVGNCCLKNIFIRNSNGLIKAASIAGLKLLDKTERELPTGNRYLPTPANSEKPLGRRIRTETILTFTSA